MKKNGQVIHRKYNQGRLMTHPYASIHITPYLAIKEGSTRKAGELRKSVKLDILLSLHVHIQLKFFNYIDTALM